MSYAEMHPNSETPAPGDFLFFVIIKEDKSPTWEMHRDPLAKHPILYASWQQAENAVERVSRQHADAITTVVRLSKWVSTRTGLQENELCEFIEEQLPKVRKLSLILLQHGRERGAVKCAEVVREFIETELRRPRRSQELSTAVYYE